MSITLTSSVTDTTAYNGTTGAISISNITGGTSPYSWSWADTISSTVNTWSTGDAAITRSGLYGGEYFFTVTDSAAATVSVQFTVKGVPLTPAQLLFNATIASGYLGMGRVSTASLYGRVLVAAGIGIGNRAYKLADVFVYLKNGNTWTQASALTATPTDTTNYVGGVATNGSMVAVLVFASSLGSATNVASKIHLFVVNSDNTLTFSTTIDLYQTGTAYVYATGLGIAFRGNTICVPVRPTSSEGIKAFVAMYANGTWTSNVVSAITLSYSTSATPILNAVVDVGSSGYVYISHAAVVTGTLQGQVCAAYYNGSSWTVNNNILGTGTTSNTGFYMRADKDMFAYSLGFPTSGYTIYLNKFTEGVLTAMTTVASVHNSNFALFGNTLVYSTATTTYSFAKFRASDASAVSIITSANLNKGATATNSYDCILFNGTDVIVGTYNSTGNMVIASINANTPTIAASLGSYSYADHSFPVSVSGGIQGYTYSWADDVAITTYARSITTSGTYTLTARDVYNNTATATGTFGFALSGAVVSYVTTAGAGDGSISEVTITGGTAPYTYLWSNGATASSLSGLVEGTYTVTVTDAMSVTASATYTVLTNAPIVISTLANTVLADTNANFSVTLSSLGVGVNSVRLYCGDVHVALSEVLTAQTVAFTGLLPATAYSMRVLFDYVTSIGVFVEASGTTTLTTYEAPAVVAFSCTATTLTSATFSVQLQSVNAAVTVMRAYCGTAYTDLSVATLEAQTVTVTGLTSGTTYTAQIKYDYGAAMAYVSSVGSSLSVRADTPPIVSTLSFTSSTQTSVTLQAQLASIGSGAGARLYAGSTDYTELALTTSVQSIIVTGLASGTTYSCQIKYYYASTPTVFTVIGAAVNAATADKLTISASTVTPATYWGLGDGAISYTLTTGGATAYTLPLSFTWNDGITTQNRSALTAGDYSVIICGTSGTFETITHTFTVTQPAGSGTAASRSSLLPGSYTLRITDAQGTFKDVIYTVPVRPAVILTPGTITKATSYNGATGSIASTTVAGGGLYSFAWSDSGINTASRSALVSGSYILTVTEAQGSIASWTFVVGYIFTVTGGTVVNQVATGSGDGSVGTPTVTGALEPITYLWSNSATTSSITNLVPGTYNVTVTDANGVSITSSVYTVGTKPPVTLTPGSITNCTVYTSSNGSIATTTVAGGGSYTYSWSDNGSIFTSSRSSLAVGYYTLTVTEAQGNTASHTFTVTSPITLTSGTITNITATGQTNGSIGLATVSGGFTPYTYAYSWGDSAVTTSNRTSLAAGSYTLTVTDPIGATAVRTYTVGTKPQVVLTQGSIMHATGYNVANGSISITSVSGGGTYTYAWSDGSSTATSRSSLVAGSYTLTVTESQGNSASTTFAVSYTHSFTAGNTVNISSAGQYDGSIAGPVAYSGGKPGFSYIWS
jgi:hypothetical protein